MPKLEISNLEEGKIARVENGAQVNKIERIQVDGVELLIDGKTINIPLATQADINQLFAEEV